MKRLLKLVSSSNKLDLYSATNKIIKSIDGSDSETDSSIDSINHNNNSHIPKQKNEEDSDIDSVSDSTNESSIEDRKYMEEIESATKNINRPSSSQTSSPHPNNDSKSNIGNVTVENSTDSTFGDKIICHGPITINKFASHGTNSKNVKSDEKKNYCQSRKLNSDENTGSENASVESENANAESDCKVYRNPSRAVIFFLTFCLIVILLGYLCFITITSKDSTDPLHIVPYKEWHPKRHEHLIRLKLPATKVIILDTYQELCSYKTECITILADTLANPYIWMTLNGFKSNFLISSDGTIYAWRYWFFQGKLVSEYDENSISVALIGSFIDKEPTKQQLNSTQQLIAEGVKLKKISADYKLYGLRQLGVTESPGQALYKLIQAWDHWSD